GCIRRAAVSYVTIVFFKLYVVLRLLHSFPTRRSSDLHPRGYLHVQDIFVPAMGDYRQGFRGPGKLDGSVVTWVNGALLRAVTVKDRKSTRLNSSHSQISYAVFCLKKKKRNVGTGSMIS